MTFTEYLIQLAEVAFAIIIIGAATSLFVSLVVNAWHNASNHCETCTTNYLRAQRPDAADFSNGRS